MIDVARRVIATPDAFTVSEVVPVLAWLVKRVEELEANDIRPFMRHTESGVREQ